MRHPSLPAAILALSAVLLIAPQPAAQVQQQPQPSQPQPPVTFRSEANFVEVHAIVTGPDGHALLDAGEVRAGDAIEARLRQGIVRATVTGTRE